MGAVEGRCLRVELKPGGWVVEMVIETDRLLRLLQLGLAEAFRYWCDIKGVRPGSSKAPHDAKSVCDTLLVDVVTGKEHRVSYTNLRSGLKTMCDLYPKYFGMFWAGEENGPIGDAFLQCCLFGRIIYG